MLRDAAGTLEVVIDETGRVLSAVLPQSIHPQYDGNLLSAARGWRFKPAMRNGLPVPYLKVIEIRLRRTPG
jgi:TonB family protein